MTLGLLFWALLFLALNADKGMFILYGIFLLAAIVVGILGAFLEKK